VTPQEQAYEWTDIAHRRYFARSDVYPMRIEPTNKHAFYGPVEDLGGSWFYTVQGEPRGREKPSLVEAIQNSFLGCGPLIGTYNLSKEDKVTFLALDIDQHDEPDRATHRGPTAKEQISSIMLFCKRVNLPFTYYGIARSKGGKGFHFAIYFAEPTDGYVARNLGKAIIREARLPRKTEIFPKQDRLEHRRFGNLIAIPGSKKWFDKTGGSCYLDENLDPVPFTQMANHLRGRVLWTREHLELFGQFFGIDLFAEEQPERHEDFTAPEDVVDGSDPTIEAAARRYVAAQPGAPKGQREVTAYRIACALVRDFCVSDDLSGELLAQWNARCEETHDEHIILRKIINAHRSGKYPYGARQGEMMKRWGPRIRKEADRERKHSRKDDTIKAKIVDQSLEWILYEARDDISGRLLKAGRCGHLSRKRECDNGRCLDPEKTGKISIPCNDAIICRYCGERYCKIRHDQVRDQWPAQMGYIHFRPEVPGDRHELRKIKARVWRLLRKNHIDCPRQLQSMTGLHLFLPEDKADAIQRLLPDEEVRLISNRNAARIVLRALRSVHVHIQRLIEEAETQDDWARIADDPWISEKRQPRTTCGHNMVATFPWPTLDNMREAEAKRLKEERDGVDSCDCLNCKCRMLETVYAFKIKILEGHKVHSLKEIHSTLTAKSYIQEDYFRKFRAEAAAPG